jgi:fructuronate reductase
VKLNRRDLIENRAEWLAKGYLLPGFDMEATARATEDAPEWVHFGAGNLFRALPAALSQWALDRGRTRAGILAAAGYDGESLDAAYRPFDNLSVLALLRPDGSYEKRIIASVAETAAMNDEAGWARLVRAFESPSLKLASLTVTEKVYAVRDAAGHPLPEAARDMEVGPGQPESYMGRIAALIYRRFLAGALPMALVSMDNVSRNGDKLAEAVLAFAEAWAARSLAEPGFPAYVRDREKLGFPLTMVDKITPRPDEKVAAFLEADGLTGVRPINTSKGSLAAPYVNAEEAQYLVMEDWFPNGRPEISGAPGVEFTTREGVTRAERMKVCACLNPLHTALAVFGCLLGYGRISDEMRDPDLKRLIETLGYREGLPTVEPCKPDPEEFLTTLIERRLPSPLPDTPQRIATDTSQKLAVRFGETIKAHLSRPGLSVENLKAVPLILAGWLRYLLAVDDAGNSFELSPDPMLPALRSALSNLHLGSRGPFSEALRPILSNAAIFGVDLVEIGLAGRVERYFGEMSAAPGAVRAALGKFPE